MDKSQAEAIAQAVLEPDRKAQEELRRKRRAEERSLAERRKVAWFMLAGALLGAVTVHFTGHRFAQGIIWVALHPPQSAGFSSSGAGVAPRPNNSSKPTPLRGAA